MRLEPLPGFFVGDGVLKGKGISALQNSKANRSELISLFGGIDNLPTSVMRAKRAKVSAITDEPTAKRSYSETRPFKDKIKHSTSKALRAAYNISGVGVANGALSTFPQNIGRSMVLLYSEPESIIFDPFAGHNSRMDLCIKAGRHYVGCDISKEFMAFNKKRAVKLRKQHPFLKIKLHLGDSRSVPVKSQSADMTITSPPYFDIEWYGDEEGQLGKAGTYQDFLDGLGLVMQENFRVLKSGSYAVWFVNDFRRKGKFHLYHMDVVRLAKRAGFIPHDLVVVDFGNSIRDCFTTQIIQTRILPKRHEYGLVFRKPEK